MDCCGTPDYVRQFAARLSGGYIDFMIYRECVTCYSCRFYLAPGYRTSGHVVIDLAILLSEILYSCVVWVTIIQILTNKEFLVFYRCLLFAHKEHMLRYLAILTSPVGLPFTNTVTCNEYGNVLALLFRYCNSS